MITDYLSRTGTKQSALARKAGISKQLLFWHIKYPTQPWSKANAEKVVKAIYGEIIREKVMDLVLGE